MEKLYSRFGKCEIIYHKRKGGGYFAKIPLVTKQILGVGKTKREAYIDLRSSMEYIKKNQKLKNKC